MKPGSCPRPSGPALPGGRNLKAPYTARAAALGAANAAGRMRRRDSRSTQARTVALPGASAEIGRHVPDRAIFQDATRSPLKLQTPLRRLSDATPVPLQVVPKVNGQTRLTRGGVPTTEIPLSFPVSSFASRIRACRQYPGWLATVAQLDRRFLAAQCRSHYSRLMRAATPLWPLSRRAHRSYDTARDARTSAWVRESRG